MTNSKDCPYKDCDLHKRYAQNFCPTYSPNKTEYSATSKMGIHETGVSALNSSIAEGTNKQAQTGSGNPIDYESCPVYQVWREQESKIVEIVGMDTKKWEELRGYQDG